MNANVVEMLAFLHLIIHQLTNCTSLSSCYREVPGPSIYLFAVIRPLSPKITYLGTSLTRPVLTHLCLLILLLMES